MRAYKLLRSNKEFEVKKKYVHIYGSDIIDSTKNDLTKIKIRCGKGFYVRSFARDLADNLDSKGHVFSLKRTKVGKFCLENSILLDDLLKIRQTRFGFRDIHPSISMLDDILAYEIDDEKLIKEVSQGKSFKIDTDFFLKDSLDLNERSIIFLTNNKRCSLIWKV